MTNNNQLLALQLVFIAIIIALIIIAIYLQLVNCNYLEQMLS